MNWKLSSHLGLDVSLRNYEKLTATTPNVNIQATSTTLMRLGFDETWQEMQSILTAFGGTVQTNKVSRVDACVDLPGVAIEELYAPFAQGWLASRAKHRRTYQENLFSSEHFDGRKVTGYAVGKSPLRLDVYDKLREVSRAPDKLPLLQHRRWGGSPEFATRVELQIRRQKLLKLGVDSVEDWIAKRSTIIDKLTREWFRLTDGPVDRKHVNRTPMHPRWLEVRQAFADWTGQPKSTDLAPIRPGHAEISREVAQIVGRLISLFARIGKPITDNERFFREATFLVRDGVGRRDMSSEVARRAHQLGLTAAIGDDF